MGKTNFKIDYMNDQIVELTNKCDHKMLAIWAADCAEHVLSYFEERYPQDNRPRKAIEAGRTCLLGELKMTDARKAAFAAHAAARKADDDSAKAVARACGQAAGTCPRCWSRSSRSYLCRPGGWLLKKRYQPRT